MSKTEERRCRVCDVAVHADRQFWDRRVDGLYWLCDEHARSRELRRTRLQRGLAEQFPGLSRRARNAILRAFIDHGGLGELLSMTDADLLALPAIGPETVAELHRHRRPGLTALAAWDEHAAMVAGV